MKFVLTKMIYELQIIEQIVMIRVRVDALSDDPCDEKALKRISCTKRL